MQPKDKNDSVEFPTRYQCYMFAKRHLGARGGYQVFPLGEGDAVPEESGRTRETEGIYSTAITTNYHKGVHSGGETYVIPVLTHDRPVKRQDGRRFKEAGDPAFTLTAQDKHGVMIGNQSIRRLTPTECCRLQSFSDNWTKYGTFNQTIIKEGLLCEKAMISKLNKKRYAQWKAVRESGKQTSVIASCTINDGSVEAQLMSPKKAITEIKNANIVITRLESVGQWGCVINITRCNGSTKTRYTWSISEKSLEAGGASGIGREGQNIELSWKLTSVDNSKEERLSTISTLFQPIIESIIFTFPQGRMTLVSMHRLDVISGKTLTLAVSDLSMEYIKEISNTMRYKCLGNAVTVNVVEAIMGVIKSQMDLFRDKH